VHAHGLLHDGIERLGIDRLREVVKRAVLEGLHGGADGGSTRHEHDGHVQVVLSDLFQELDAAHARHHDVAHHDVEGAPAQALHGFFTVARLGHRVALRLQATRHATQQLRLVIDEQHPSLRAFALAFDVRGRRRSLRAALAARRRAG
jgi:hypothetical protein